MGESVFCEDTMKSNHPTLLKRMRAERKRIAVGEILKHAEGKHLLLEVIVNHYADVTQDDHCYVEDLKRLLGFSDASLATYMNALVVDELVEVHDINNHERVTPTARGVAFNGQNHILREAYEHVDRINRERWALRLSVLAVIISVAALIRTFF